MTNEREGLSELINRTSEIEKLLTPASGTGIPWQKTALKTMYDKPEFILWKNQLKYQLQDAPQDQLIQETVNVLDKGFRNGFTDEKDFRELKAKLYLYLVQTDIDAYLISLLINKERGGHINKNDKFHGELAPNNIPDDKLDEVSGGIGHQRYGCPKCGALLYESELTSHQKVCPFADLSLPSIPKIPAEKQCPKCGKLVSVTDYALHLFECSIG